MVDGADSGLPRMEVSMRGSGRKCASNHPETGRSAAVSGGIVRSFSHPSCAAVWHLSLYSSILQRFEDPDVQLHKQKTIDDSERACNPGNL